MNILLQIRLFFSWMATTFLLLVAVTSQASELELSDSPLFLGTQIDPNVFFMLDDSGSMDWEILTVNYEYYSDYWSNSNNNNLVTSGYFRAYSNGGSSCTGTRNNTYYFSNDDDVYDSCSYASVSEHVDAQERDWRVRSSALNILYYNPAITYYPWIGFSNASFTSARSNPQSGSNGYNNTRDLTGFSFDVAIDDHSYSGSSADGPTDVSDTPNGQVDLFDSHTKYTVNNATIDVEAFTTENAADMIARDRDCDSNDYLDNPPYADCFGTTVVETTLAGANLDPWGRSIVEIQQNVANWYQYHRRRSFVAKSAISRVINSSNSFRFGLSLINEYDTLFEEVPASSVEDYTLHNAALLQGLYDFEWQSNSTPLRRGLERVGRYYSNYYSEYNDPIISACQQNYSVLFTDGYWNGSSPNTSAIGDEDGDGHSDTVADVAEYFYTEDLSDLANQVPTSVLDSNNKQHMVSFTVAFGVKGNLVDSNGDGYPDPELEKEDDWGNADSNAEKIDDLWHAAFNSKGFFVSAQSPDEVANAISDSIANIADRVGSSASVAVNSGSLKVGSHLFQARFDSSDWKGQLLAYTVNVDGSIDETPIWDAGVKVSSQNYDSGREIITFNDAADVIPGGDIEGQGIAFRFPGDYNTPNNLSEFNNAQISSLMTNAPYPVSTTQTTEIASNAAYGQGITNYLRGDTVNEGVGLGFRNRSSALGDIVNSDPRFVGAPNFQYPDAIQSRSYADFIDHYKDRVGIVYVGANDGMLHAFNEAQGNELLAYVPSQIYDKLNELSRMNYSHRYLVDAGPTIVDAFLPNKTDPISGGSGAWRSVLTAGLGGGGQGIYSLDVTDPARFDEINAAELVLWEFDDSDDADLGYTYGRPQIAKLANGRWAAVFGNGYNNTTADGQVSSTGNAVLYIVDIESGELIRKIDTLAGSTTTPNGLATPLLVDENADLVVDYIYAGDLLGNLWKFDVSDSNDANWDIAYSQAGVGIPLFETAQNQAITTQPQAAFHPDGRSGFMIYFGTGKYLEVTDNESINQPLQAFYGVWDKNETTLNVFDGSDLLSQTIDNQYVKEFDTDADGVDDTEYTLRDVSSNTIDFDSHMGWKIDLSPVLIEGVSNSNNFGERQISNAIVRDGKVIFTTVVPSQIECEYGGMSFIMELNYRNGGALAYPAFDLNKDGNYDAIDGQASGRASNAGLMPTVSILSNGAENIAFGSGASGDIDIIELSAGNEAYGRQSWRQLE